jgi:hypothetical protein
MSSEHQDSTGKPIKVGDRVRWNGAEHVIEKLGLTSSFREPAMALSGVPFPVAEYSVDLVTPDAHFMRPAVSPTVVAWCQHEGCINEATIDVGDAPMYCETHTDDRPCGCGQCGGIPVRECT